MGDVFIAENEQKCIVLRKIIEKFVLREKKSMLVQHLLFLLHCSPSIAISVMKLEIF